MSYTDWFMRKVQHNQRYNTCVGESTLNENLKQSWLSNDTTDDMNSNQRATGEVYMQIVPKGGGVVSRLLALPDSGKSAAFAIQHGRYVKV